MYTMDDFWLSTMGQSSVPILMERIPVGWAADIKSLSTFIEAPLEIADGFGSEIPYPILLVSAPGAVGKSTLAREISARTGAILVDLAHADAVGAATVTGGLAWAGLFDGFIQGNVALLIDGLDEARIRVTKDSFSAFLEDIGKLASADRKPITLFGRTSAVEDAWLHFALMGFEPPVLEIQFYGNDAALEFATRRIADDREENGEDVNASAAADRRAVTQILKRLENQTQAGGDRFVGYAPVLIAVSKRVAAERNPMALVSDLEGGAEALSLNSIVDAILEREKTKLDRLEFADPDLKETLYDKNEQVERLISAVYKIDHVPHLPEMNHKDAATYTSALNDWVPDHPFTDGSGERPSSEVFGGFIAAEALKKGWASENVRKKELGGAKVNPFICRFRLPDCWLELNAVGLSKEPEFVPLADLGLVFTSLQAGLSRLESAHLFIDADTDRDGNQPGHAEVEITQHLNEAIIFLRLSTDSDGTVYFGSRIRDVNISGNEISVITSGTETTFTAPVDFDVGEIDSGHSGIVIEGSRRSTEEIADVVRLRCLAFNWSSNSLSIRPNVELAVDWPGSESFPWHRYRKPDIPDGFDDQLAERFRRLRKILILFRARGMGQLAKFKGAIDHERRIRGSGAAVRDLLLQEGVLFEDSRVYVLDTDRLREVLGLNIVEIRSATVNEQTIAFLRRV